jgi:hypothetical protein
MNLRRDAPIVDTSRRIADPAIGPEMVIFDEHSTGGMRGLRLS